MVWLKSWGVLRRILSEGNEQEIDIMADAELEQMRKANVYISMRASLNGNELAGVPPEKLEMFQRRWLGRVHYAERVHNTRWCSAKWPTPLAAHEAHMSEEEFDDYYLRVCVDMDYEKMSQAMDALVTALDKTDRIRIVSPGTDISFSKKTIPSRKCAGDVNIPDGEVFTAPVKDSVNGYITYNIPTDYFGHRFEGISLVIKDGKIVNATCQVGDEELLNSIFRIDQGASYIGEFAFGVNPMITKPIHERMFDEKMAGSIHITPGNSYREAWNGNESGVHWDLILNQTTEYGGGEIYFDDILVRKDGLFVVPELEGLNPDKLNL